MKRIVFIFLFMLSASISNLYGQTFYKHFDISLTKNSVALPYPWIGGLNNAQFANADVNRDNKKDVVVYDNYNRQFHVFLVNAFGSTQYAYAPQYAAHFPDISNWMILKDYNCDAIPDLFTYNGLSNTKVFKGYYDSDTLKFILQQNGFFYNNGITNVYSVDVSRPVIEDINKDGDLDFISFETFGTYLYYYENQRVERGLSCDTLIFNLVDRCWGNVRDTFSASYSIRDTCMGKFRIGNTQQVLHTGSFMESLDLDNNGKMDLLIGNIGIQNLTALYNQGTLSYGSILKQDAKYPSYDTQYESSSMATPMKLDVDNDGKNDLIVSTFDVGSNNIDNIYYYKNLSADSFKLTLQTKKFLLNDILDNGENSAPCILDFNNDGLKDILIGNGGYRDNLNPIKYTLELYKNIGTSSVPRYVLENADFLDVSTFGVKDLVPASGDIDNDGDVDLLMGIQTGNVLWWENTAGSGNVSNFLFRAILKDNAGNDILVQQQATPYIADLDKDGKNDLLIGDKNGRISFYKGSGTNSIALTLVTSTYGKIRTNAQFNNFGYVHPVVADVNHDNKLDLICGSSAIGLIWYNNIEQYLVTDSFISNGPLLSDKIISRTASAIADLTSDGNWELLLGNYNGGLWYYSENMPTVTAVPERTTKKLQIAVYPNPANEYLNLVFDTNEKTAYAFIYAPTGELIKTFELVDNENRIQISDLPSGMYILYMHTAQASGFLRFIKE